MNWSTMSARERDAAVAEKVMGWFMDKPQTQFNHPFWVSGEGVQCLKADWHPSTDPRDCAAVKALCEGYEIHRLIRDRVEQPDVLDFRVGVKLRGKLWAYETGPTEELAFCLAALRAVGVEVDL